MAESFLIANHVKRQWLNPDVLPARYKFPSILRSEFMQAAITLLICTTKSIMFEKSRSQFSELTKNLLGAWSEGGALAIGDYSEEELSREIVDSYEDISLPVLTLILEAGLAGSDVVFESLENADKDWLNLINQVLTLEGTEEIFEKDLKRAFGKNWRDGFYEALYRM